MIWKTIARWVVLAIAAPLAALGIRKLSDSIEAKRGKTRATGVLRKSADGLDWVSGRPSKGAVTSR